MQLNQTLVGSPTPKAQVPLLHPYTGDPPHQNLSEHKPVYLGGLYSPEQAVGLDAEERGTQLWGLSQR